MRTHTRRRHDRGMTLVEVLVSMFLLSIVGTIVAGVVISALKVTTTSASSVESEAQINDAVSRITRDVAAADPILWTSTTTSPAWPANSPSANEMWTQAVRDGNCVRTRYWVDSASTPKRLRATTQTYAADACPNEGLPSTAPAITTTLIANLKTTDDNGTPLDVFSYYDKTNNPIAAPPAAGPMAQANVAKIARVQLNVGAVVRNRAKGVRLVTSAAPRHMINPALTDAPPTPAPDCIDAKWGASDTPLTYDAGTPAAPVITWDTTANAADFTLTRVSPNPYTWPPSTSQPGSITDTAMRGTTGTPFVYSLEINGPGGIVTCGPRSLAAIPPPTLSAPTLTVTVTPNTSSGPQNVGTPTVNLSWTPAPGIAATAYTIWRRPIDPNLAPYNATGAGTWTAIANTTSTTWNQQPGFNQAFEYAVTAENDNYNPTITSAKSNTGKALTHTNAITLTGNPLTYRTNRLTWTKDSGSTVDGYALFRRPTGTSAWGAPVWTTNNVNLLTYDDTTAALDSRNDYLITSYNVGPRGTGAMAGNITYYGDASNTVTVLQFPSTPTMNATGTEVATNPDGTNTADWTAVPSATSYELWESDTPGGAPTSTRTGLATTAATDTGNPRGTRNFYMAVAVNPTGKSENAVNAALRAAATDDAYQRPADLTATAGNTVADGCPDVAESATNAVFNCADGTATAGWPANNADAGEATDKFCSGTNPGMCKYIPVVEGVQQAPVTGNPTTRTLTVTQSGWGNNDKVAVLACNQGGCSDKINTTVRSYPGPFDIDTVNVSDETWHDQWWENGGHQNFDRHDATAYVHWTNSRGTRADDPYKVQRTEVANDRFDVVWTNKYDLQNTGDKKSTAGAVYRYAVTSFAANGLERTAPTKTVQIPPAKGGFLQSAKFCNSNTRVVGYGPSTYQRVCHDEQQYKQVDVLVWVDCSQSNPGPDCVNKGGTPDWEKQEWAPCDPRHAGTNPGGSNCDNKVLINNKHWMKNTGTTANPNWVDCGADSSNNAWQATNPDTTNCRSRDSAEPKHWAKQVWVNCSPNQAWPTGPSGCTNNGGTPYWRKQVTTQEWQWVTVTVCEDVEVQGDPIYDNINNWGWKGVYKFRRGGFDNDGGQTYNEKWDWVEFVGRLSNPSHTTFQNKAQAVEFATPPASGFPDKPKTWTTGVAYWQNGTQNINDGTTTGERVAASSFGATEELISNNVGSGAFYQVRARIAQAGAHDADSGEWSGRALGLVDYKISDTKFDCGGGWSPMLNLISRYAHANSPAHYRPGSTMTDWNTNG